MPRTFHNLNPYEYEDPHGIDRCEHGTPLDDSCEDCLLDVVAERLDRGEHVTPDLQIAVGQRELERRR